MVLFLFFWYISRKEIKKIMTPNQEKKKKDLPTPSKIGNYSIIKKIALGGMGEIFLAKDQILNRKIVIKRARPDLVHHQIIKDRFSKEVKITSQLFHPSIIPIYAIHKDGSDLYYTMPYVEGKSLKQILRESVSDEKKGESSWSTQALIRIFQNVCHGVSFCHSKGFLHRDLKPENILVGNHGEVYIVDWGLATDMNDLQEEKPVPSILTFSMNQDLTRPGKVFGTLPYLPPERIGGNKATIASEIYSLGVILYQLLTLRMPFYRRTMKEYKLSKKYQRPIDLIEAAPFRNISVKLSNIVKKCLNDNPNKRFKSVDELINEIEKYEEGTPSWIYKKTLALTNKDDWEIQENILSSNLSSFGFGHRSLSWKYLMIATEKVYGNQKLTCAISLKENSKGVNFYFNIPDKDNRENLEDGYCIHIGSKKYPGVLLQHCKVVLYEKNDCYLSEEKKSNISIEKKDKTITLFINDTKIFSYEDYLPIVGSQVGFSCEDMDFSFKKIDIFVTSNKKTAGCLAVPNALFSSKHFKEAIEEYSRVALSFKGQKEAHEALFNSGYATIYQAKEKRWHLTRNSLYEKAFTTFNSLHNITTGPLSLLGKSLVYKEKEDFIEEGKCLELALHRYKKHPLIHTVENHIHRRLHECALSFNDRRGVYFFSLLILTHCPSFLDFKETHSLILSLPLSDTKLYFLSSPSSQTSLQHLYKEMIIGLNFHLERWSTLKFLREDHSFISFKDQISFALLYLKKENKTFLSPGKILTALPEKVYKKHFWPLFFHIEKGVIEKNLTTLKLIKTLEEDHKCKDDDNLLITYKIEIALVTGNIKIAGDYFNKNSSFSSSDPLFFLFGCYLALCGEEKEAVKHFSKCKKQQYPCLASITPLYIDGRVSLSKEFLSSCFLYEKITLYKNLFIYYTTLNKPVKADYYINKIKDQSPWTNK